MGSSMPTNLSKYKWVDTITSIMKYKKGPLRNRQLVLHLLEINFIH